MNKLLIIMILAILASSFAFAQSYFQVPDYVEEYVFEATPYLIYGNSLSSISLDAGLHLDKTITNDSMRIYIYRPDGSELNIQGNYSADLDKDILINSAIYEVGSANWTSEMLYKDNLSMQTVAGKHIDVTFSQYLVSGDRVCVFLDDSTQDYPEIYLCDGFNDCDKGVDDIGVIAIERSGYTCTLVYFSDDGENNHTEIRFQTDPVAKLTLNRIYAEEVAEMKIYDFQISGDYIVQNVTSGYEYGTYSLIMEDYQGFLIARSGFQVDELTSDALAKFINFQPQGVDMVEADEWASNEWKFYSTDFLNITSVNCSINHLNATSEEVVITPYEETIDHENNIIKVRWFSNSTQVIEGQNYEVECSVDIDVGTEVITVGGIEQYVYINRQKSFWAFMQVMWEWLTVDLWNATTEINETTQVIRNNTIYIMNQTDLIKADTEWIIEEIGNETDESIKEILIRPVMQSVT